MPLRPHFVPVAPRWVWYPFYADRECGSVNVPHFNHPGLDMKRPIRRCGWVIEPPLTKQGKISDDEVILCLHQRIRDVWLFHLAPRSTSREPLLGGRIVPSSIVFRDVTGRFADHGPCRQRIDRPRGRYLLEELLAIFMREPVLALSIRTRE